MLLAALVSVGRLVAVVPRPDAFLSSRPADAAHVVLCLTMAAMFGFWSAEVRVVVCAVLMMGCVAFGVSLTSSIVGRAQGAGRAGSAYHLTAVMVMLGMAMLMTPMVGRDPMPEPALGDGLQVAARVLAVVVALDTVGSAIVGFLLPRGPLTRAGVDLSRARSRAALRTATVPHVVMGAGMVSMLLSV